MNALVTGGAGFIGSHLADALIEEGHAVRVLDDLSTGLEGNVDERVDFIKGDVADAEVVVDAIRDIEVVFHQAAIGSVQRSVDDPRTTDRANTHGTLTILNAAAQGGVRRVVLASSSSIYGGAAELPARESARPDPKSPYAVTKLTAELYAKVMADLTDLETVCLRYFNVYGPRQRADSAYAAVIPLFISALASGDDPVIFGDGLQTRDFTFVLDAVRANLVAAAAPGSVCTGGVYNVAGGEQHSLLDVLDVLGQLMGVETSPIHQAARPGDVRHSAADLTLIRDELGFEPATSLEDGLRRVLQAR